MIGLRGRVRPDVPPAFGAQSEAGVLMLGEIHVIVLVLVDIHIILRRLTFTPMHIAARSQLRYHCLYGSSRVNGVG